MSNKILTVKDIMTELAKYPENMIIGLSATKNDEEIARLEVSSWQPNVLNIIGKSPEWHGH